jgi:hypothetical protein
MTNMSIKTLTTDQYEAAREKAIERVKGRIGDKPTREQFRREMATIFTPLDYLAMIVFAAALIISSAHILTHMGKITGANFDPGYATGIVLGQAAYTIAHQIGMIFLAEASMLLFMVMHGMSSAERAQHKGVRKVASIPLALAIIAGLFVFIANIQSGIGLLESLMPPLFTVGIGFRLETLIVELLKRRNEIDARYISAIDVYERATADPTAHPDFVPFFRQAIWEKLIGIAANRDWKDAPAGARAAAVRREMERDAWAYGDQMIPDEAWQPERPTKPQNARSRSGNSAPEPDEGDDTQPMQIGSAPIDGASDRK